MSFSVSSLQTGLLSGIYFLRKHPLAGASSLAATAAGTLFREPLQEIVKNALSWNSFLYCGGALISISFAYNLCWFCKTYYFEMPEKLAKLQKLKAERNQLTIALEITKSEKAILERLPLELQVH